MSPKAFHVIAMLLPSIFLKSKGKGKVVPVLLTEHHAMKAYWGSGAIVPRILDLGTTWK
jgi:hypothetical protein